MNANPSMVPFIKTLRNEQVSIEICVADSVTVRSLQSGDVRFLRRQDEPLIRWRSYIPHQTLISCDARRETVGYVFPDGLHVDVDLAEPLGAHGEISVPIRLHNPTNEALYGRLSIPFLSWTDAHFPEPKDALIGDRFAYIPPYSYLPDAGRMITLPITEGAWDVCAALSHDQRFVGAYLLRDGRDDEQGIIENMLDGDETALDFRIGAGETVRATWKIDGGAGTWRDALDQIYRQRGFYRVNPAEYDGSLYDAPEHQWLLRAVTSMLNWAWDTDNIDPWTGEYRFDQLFQSMADVAGGLDLYMLWPFWPRCGYDARNQFDHFRQMPGGIPGLRAQIDRIHERGGHVLLGYCSWSETTEGADSEAFAASVREMVHVACEIDADGLVLDCMNDTPDIIDRACAEYGKRLLCLQEFFSGWRASQTNLMGRIHNCMPMPAFNLKKYLLPRHLQLRVCEPGNLNRSYRRDMALSFFSGHGIEMNTMFPERYPRAVRDLRMWVHCARILRENSAAFTSADWVPFVPSGCGNVLINQWNAPHGAILYTMISTQSHGEPVCALKAAPAGYHFIDLYNQTALPAADELHYAFEPFQRDPAMPDVQCSVGCIGAFRPILSVEFDMGTLRIRADRLPAPSMRIDVCCGGRAEGISMEFSGDTELDLYTHFGATNESIAVKLFDERGNLADMLVLGEESLRFYLVPPAYPPMGTRESDSEMIPIPGGCYTFGIVHPISYAGIAAIGHTCYPHEGRDVYIEPMHMQRHPVTNAEFARFLRESGYAPANPANFLAHWRDGHPDPELLDHPVVYVSLEDARAYAAFYGMRLPTEPEWQYAAGASDGRLWPWGIDFHAELCNNESGRTAPVDRHPGGESPFGVRDLVGNVWQWTDTVTDNGAHIHAYIKGGCFFVPPRELWWVVGGPRRINDHQPLPLMGPSMNRFATVGFRCVRPIH